jgi:GNAT superfamily N-acetyltransferase
MRGPGFTIAPTSLHDGAAQALIGELDRELAALYPEPGATHFRLDPDEVAAGTGSFLLARDAAGEPLGCGAVRRVAPGVVELKRMFTRPAARRTGVGRALLAALEEAARALGATRLVLETGSRSPEAIALYERAGFVRTAPWGEYLASADTSVCMEKSLAP